MPLSLYDTLSREILPVRPMDGETLRFYCCGPTVYGPAHIGNFRTFVMQDVFRRVVEAGGMATRHVRNLTDVDDKTIRRSQEEGLSRAEFTAAWTVRFHADCAALGILPPHVEPSAVGHLPEQIALIERLIEKGHDVLISGCYRQPLNFTFASLAAARKALARLADWQRRLGGPPDFLLPGEEDFGPFGPVYDALLSDLNTPEALGRLHRIGREVVAAAEGGTLPPQEFETARHGLALVLQCLGLDLSETDTTAPPAPEAPAWVQALAAERLDARRRRDWDEADRLRDQIKEAGWLVRDAPDTSTLEPLGPPIATCPCQLTDSTLFGRRPDPVGP